MLHDGQHAWVVDPGDAEPVTQALQRENVQLQGILVTHHHPDHTAGVNFLRNATGAQVIGPALEPMPEPLRRVKGGDSVRVLDVNFEVLDVPGHTAGHLAYFAHLPHADPLLFCGDTLFSGGCGRLFEGTAAQMQHSLAQLSNLPDATRVCCAHEYTLSNLEFARTVEPDNVVLVNYCNQAQHLRAQGRPTLPSSIGLERQINPFLRWTQPTITESVRTFNAATAERDGIFATLRQWKNQYR